MINCSERRITCTYRVFLVIVVLSDLKSRESYKERRKELTRLYCEITLAVPIKCFFFLQR